MLEFLLQREVKLTDQDIFQQFMEIQMKDRARFLGQRYRSDNYLLDNHSTHPSTISWLSASLEVVLKLGKADTEERKVIVDGFFADVEFQKSRFNLYSIAMIFAREIALIRQVSPLDVAASIEDHNTIYARMFDDYHTFIDFFRKQEERKLKVTDAFEAFKAVHLRARYWIMSEVITELQEIWLIMFPRESSYDFSRKKYKREMDYVRHRAEKIYFP